MEAPTHQEVNNNSSSSDGSYAHAITIHQDHRSSHVINDIHNPPHPNHQQNGNNKSTNPITKKPSRPVIAYRECLKNHAASIGMTATDGCREFMPSTRHHDDPLQALICSACNCHRNFHRQELIIQVMTPPRIDEENIHITRAPPHRGEGAPSPKPHKRFRTKFSKEQKERMVGFAERIGWRMQKQDEGLVQEFCEGIGVRKRVFRVWMHNNKNNYVLGKKIDDYKCHPHDALIHQ